MPHNPTYNQVETFTGAFVDVGKPEPSTIKLEDIAHALSQTCRYGGHCKSFYSVAEHAVFVSIRLERRGEDDKTQMMGLHHDDAEAYLGDIPRPMKPLLGASYERMSDRMDAAICQSLGLPYGVESLHDPAIKDADNWSLFVEARHLLPSQGKGWWDGEQGSYKWNIGELPSRIITPDYFQGGLLPPKARLLYLKRHTELTERLGIT